MKDDIKQAITVWLMTFSLLIGGLNIYVILSFKDTLQETNQLHEQKVNEINKSVSDVLEQFKELQELDDKANDNKWYIDWLFQELNSIQVELGMNSHEGA